MNRFVEHNRPTVNSAVRNEPQTQRIALQMTFSKGKCVPLAIGSQRGTVCASVLQRKWRSSAFQLRVQPSKDENHRAAPAEGKLQSASRMDQARGQVHHLLHDGAIAPTLGAVTRRGIRAEQSVLSDPAQPSCSGSSTPPSVP